MPVAAAAVIAHSSGVQRRAAPVEIVVLRFERSEEAASKLKEKKKAV